MTMKLTLNEDELEQIAYDAIKERLASSIAHNQFTDVVNRVMVNRREELEALLNGCMDTVLSSPEMKETLVTEFRHRVAKNLVGDLQGAVEKAVNVFKGNPILKAKLIVTIENMIAQEGSN